ncbi:hypothetical protein [Maridesulfovibrio sp.]|uniref:hypothetical protein n=1 Tax=Maridesulfovibrio sp. TaxID=2795000 RepID=UPI002A188676|nr:hypothetical protein [Maridesulfovibrio sp.]
MKPLVKVRLLQIVAENELITSDALFEIIAQEYQGERFVTPENLDEYLRSFATRGLLETRQMNAFTFDGVEQKMCRVTDMGKRSLKALL